MESILGRFRNLIVLAAILFAQIVGLALQVKRPAGQGETRLIRIWTVGAITPFETAVVGAQKFVHDTWHNYLYLRGVRRENRELRAELDRMKLDQVRLKEDADMARRIQSLLAFKEQHIDTTIAAQVIGTSGSDQSRLVYIDKGSNDGITKTDLAVITPNGIVGKIVQVYPDSSQVLLINDQMSGVGVALKSTRLQGILRGGANGTTTVTYVMADERVQPGDEVITSGGDRIFPKGLPVGKVVDVKPGKDLFLNIRVLPSAQLDRLEEVLVVTKVSEKPPDTEDLGPIRASDILAQRLPTVPDKPQLDANGKPMPSPTGTTPAGASAATSATNTTGTATSNKPNANATGTAANRTASPATTPVKPTAAGVGSVVTKPAGGGAGTTAPKPAAVPSGAGVSGTATHAAGSGVSTPGTVRANGSTAGQTAATTTDGTIAKRPSTGVPSDAVASQSATSPQTTPRIRVVENDAPVTPPKPKPATPAASDTAPKTPAGENPPQR